MFTALVAVDTTAFGYTLAVGIFNVASVSFALRAIFDVYLIILATLSTQDVEVPHHWVTVVHLSALITLAFSSAFFTSILPETDDVQNYGLGSSEDTLLRALRYANLGLNLLCMIRVITISRGPKLHFPSEAIYSEKTLETSTTRHYDNVCGLSGEFVFLFYNNIYLMLHSDASVLDILLFSYTTKVVMLGVTSESLEIGDLPIVTANMRATTLFYRMQTAMRTVKSRSFTLIPGFLLASSEGLRWKPSLGSGWMLMYRLARINAVPVVTQICLATVSALLYYAPAFFLQRLVKFLEVSTNDVVKDIQWGWVYCAGLFGSYATSFLSMPNASLTDND